MKILDDIKKMKAWQKIALVCFLIITAMGLGNVVYESNAHDPQKKPAFYGIEFKVKF